MARQSLSSKLLTTVLTCVLLVGTMLSGLQILVSYRTYVTTIDGNAATLLDTLQAPASRAAFELDAEQSQEILDGLFNHAQVIHATLLGRDQVVLAEKLRIPEPRPLRFLTDQLFGQAREYSTRLKTRNFADVGELRITVDTYRGAEGFINGVLGTVVLGCFSTLLIVGFLYIAFRHLLTRPMNRLVKALATINPGEPGRHKIPHLTGHEQDELGLCVSTTNNLLRLIDENQRMRKQAEDHVSRLNHYDLLTNLPNRRFLQERLEIAMRNAARSHSLTSLLCCNLDDFGIVNEKHGYQFGDQLLIAVSKRLQHRFESANLIARVGGDQFAVLYENLSAPYEAMTLAQIMLEFLSQPFLLAGKQVQLNGSIGIAIYPQDGRSPEQLIQNAEKAMMRAKNEGRNQYQYYDARSDSSMRERKALENELRAALPRNQLSVVYQPLIDLKSGHVVGAEALLRWNHPERGSIAPMKFIPIAESSQLIVPIGAWVLQTACEQTRAWQRQGYELKIAVNLSAIQLKQQNLLSIISNALHQSELEARFLELEITETAILQEVDYSLSLLEKLRRLGVSLALDDFGTGYSSLSYLKRLPINKVKIDKEFVQDLPTDNGNTCIVQAIIQLCQNMRLTVLAEGVEHSNIEHYLRHHGCNQAQGYHYSEPLEPEAFLQFVKARNSMASGHPVLTADVERV